MPSLALDVSRLLWKTRGVHWDYEFIATPEVPSLPAWSAMLDEVLGDADPHAADLMYGVLEIIGGGGEHPYAAVRFLDPDRKDWTGRPIQHLAVWFPAIDRAASVPNVVPTDWHLQALSALGTTYGKDDAFGMAEPQVRNWPRDGKISRAAHIAGIVRTTHPIDPLNGPVNPARWKQRTSIKREIEAASTMDRQPNSPAIRWIIVPLLALLVLLIRRITRMLRE